MTIDWITVSAQVINFLILVWLLKHFLYKPVIRAMEQREQRVTERLKDAEKREIAAARLGESYSQNQVELQQNRDQILQDARDQASEIKYDLVTEARDDVAQTRASWQQQAEVEKQQFLESLQQKIVQSVSSIARKALADLANTDLESQVVTIFISKLQSLSPNDVERLQETAGPISLKSSFNLDESNQQLITQAIQSVMDAEVQPSFRPLTGKGWGIELDIAEQRLGWNIDSYLDDFDSQFKSALTSSQG